MNVVVLFLFTLIVRTSPQKVDIQDMWDAVKDAENDENLTWVQSFQPVQFCMIDNHPYTIKIELKKGDSNKIIVCYRPWRVVQWYCHEDDMTIPYCMHNSQFVDSP